MDGDTDTCNLPVSEITIWKSTYSKKLVSSFCYKFFFYISISYLQLAYLAYRHRPTN